MKTEKQPLVLLVEDNAADANLVKEALAEQQLDSVLHVLSDGIKAIDFIDHMDADEGHSRPDLVLLDLNLPKASGEDVLRRLQRSPRRHGIKVLIISSSDAPADRDRTLALGATGYFRKPSNLDQFLELGLIVRELLSSTGAPG
jgi:CheY-like chemotaxis protein